VLESSASAVQNQEPFVVAIFETVVGSVGNRFRAEQAEGLRVAIRGCPVGVGGWWGYRQGRACGGTPLRGLV